MNVKRNFSEGFRRMGERRPFCKKGHALTDDSVYVRPKNGHRSCRLCDRARHQDWWTKNTRSGKVEEPLIRSVMNALREGKTVAQITGLGPGRPGVRGGAILDNSRLHAFCRDNVKIGALIRDLSAKNRVAQRKEAAQSRYIPAAPSIIRATDDIIDAIHAAVPRHLPKDHRDDVIQNIWVAVRERRLKSSEIAARAKDFIRDEYRLNHNAWGDRSLDVPIWVDSATTLLDTLSTEQGLWR